jgi:ABC-type glycerol-3-phosphate transport system substrate-binding protein
MKMTMLALSLLAVLLGISACAKYPVVVGAGASAPAPYSASPETTR